MYRAFKLGIGNELGKEYVKLGREVKKNHVKLAKSSLNKYLDEKGVINAKSIMEDWFGEMKAEVFISHSHADEEKALWLAGILKEDFGLDAFIDSAVWGDCRDLQQILDNDYSWLDEERQVYEYGKVARSAAHVHMMLATALNKMIDRCEVVMFLETDQSITSRGAIERKTSSSWIYYELEIINSIQIKSAKSHRPEHVKFSRIQKKDEASMPHIQFPVNFERFSDLTQDVYQEWYKERGIHPKINPLDLLYKVAPQKYPIRELLLETE